MLFACDVTIPESLNEIQMMLLKAYRLDARYLFKQIQSLVSSLDTNVYKSASKKDKIYIDDMVERGYLEVIDGIVYVCDVLRFQFINSIREDCVLVELKVVEDDSPWSTYEVTRVLYKDFY